MTQPIELYSSSRKVLTGRCRSLLVHYAAPTGFAPAKKDQRSEQLTPHTPRCSAGHEWPCGAVSLLPRPSLLSHKSTHRIWSFTFRTFSVPQSPQMYATIAEPGKEQIRHSLLLKDKNQNELPKPHWASTSTLRHIDISSSSCLPHDTTTHLHRSRFFYISLRFILLLKADSICQTACPRTASASPPASSLGHCSRETIPQTKIPPTAPAHPVAPRHCSPVATHTLDWDSTDQIWSTSTTESPLAAPSEEQYTGTL